jgi:beta-1,4-N-acetylglucosaminyltransferase
MRGLSICIVSSCGGHLTEVRALKDAYQKYDHFYVVNDRVALPEDMVGRTYFIHHAERGLAVALNVVEAWRILRRERPRLILSTGAGPLIPFALIARSMKIPVLFVETLTRVRAPSLTGVIARRLGIHVFYQWPALARAYPRGTYGGPLI